jgi:DNA-nicking Smr family endonuclease
MRLGRIRHLIREALGLLPTLDLHGLGVGDAVRETEDFLRQAQAAGARSVRIVYGKGRRSRGGRGVLREVIPRWLDSDGRSLVRSYERRPDSSGVDGAVVVWVQSAVSADR